MGCGASSKSQAKYIEPATRIHVAPAGTLLDKELGAIAEGKNVIDIAALVGLCVDLAEVAGAIIRNAHTLAEIGVVDKGGTSDICGTYIPDVQTDVDREVDAFVVGVLRKAFPGVLVVCEETAEGKGDLEHSNISDAGVRRGAQGANASAAIWPLWLRAVEAERFVVFVDPLDGTSEFTQGNNECVTVLMGVAVDGVPVAGVIHQPFAKPTDILGGMHSPGLTIWGGDSVGMQGNGRMEMPTLPVLVGTNRTVRDDRIDVALQALAQDELHAQCPAEQRVSATGWHCLRVLCGKQHALLLTRSGTKKWDICGPDALLRAVGGALTDVAGRSYQYQGFASCHMNRCGVLATRSLAMHAAIVRAVGKAINAWPVGVVEDPSIVEELH